MNKHKMFRIKEHETPEINENDTHKLNKHNIKDIYSKFGQKVINIKEKSKGLEQQVWIVETDKGKSVIKNSKHMHRQILGLEICHKNNIPCPKLIAQNNGHYIEEFIGDHDLEEINTSQENLENLYFKAGQILNKFHQIKTKGFGPLQHENQQLFGPYTSQEQYIESWFWSNIKKLEKTGLLTAKEIENIKEHYSKNLKLVSNEKSALMHGDFYDSNIIANENEIKGIIDFGDIHSGPAMDDISMMYINHRDYKFDKFVQGYGKIDMEKIKFYAFLRLTWQIVGVVNYNKHKQEPDNMLKLYKELIK